MSKGKLIVVASGKGGIGKTLIANVIGQHKDINALIFSNDPKGIYPDIFKDIYIRVEDFDELDFSKMVTSDRNLIIDIRGGLDTGNYEKLIKMADLVITPAMDGYNDVSASIDSMVEIMQYNDNILVIDTNRDIEYHKKDLLGRKKDREESLLRQAMEGNNIDIPMLELRRAKLYNNALEDHMNIYDWIDQKKNRNYVYRNSIAEIEDIIQATKIMAGIE